MIYTVDTNLGKLIPNGAATLKPASGPRHLDFHTTGKFAYVINELNSTVTVFAYGKESGTLRELQTITTLPEGFSGTSYCADIHVHPSGKYLYGSNRGHDSIVAYAIDAKTGKLTLIGHEPTGGKWPRNFALDPTGRYLLVANQNTDNIVVLSVDVQTGKLKPAGQQIEIGQPVCLKFIPSFA